MTLIRSVFWVAVTLAATFFWLVLFEHGPSGFKEGISVEFENLKALIQPVEKTPEPQL